MRLHRPGRNHTVWKIGPIHRNNMSDESHLGDNAEFRLLVKYYLEVTHVLVCREDYECGCYSCIEVVKSSR